jgi:predicted transcriptional regulator
MRKKDILFFLSETARTGEEIVAFLVGMGTGRNSSFTQGAKFSSEVKRSRKLNDPEKERQREEAIRIRRLVQALKSDGLLVSKKHGNKSSYSITSEGRDWLTKKEFIPSGSISGKMYVSEPADRVTIIAYDIPYIFRMKRDWLRSRITGMGFHFLQRSVFLGKIKIPQEFMDDLEEMGISEHVEIFEITKEGTLRVPDKNLRAKV